jgi:ABC-type multidrug transport system fused ATPase/permease subunit
VKPLIQAWLEIKPLTRPYHRRILIGLVFTLLNRLSLIVIPASIGYVVDHVFAAQSDRHLPFILIALLLAAFVEAVSSRCFVHTLAPAFEGIVADFRARVQEHLLRLPVEFYDKMRSGDLVSRVLYDTESLHYLGGSNVSAGVSEVVYFIVSVGYLIYISPRMTVMALLFLGFGFVPSLVGSKRVESLSLDKRRLSAALTASISDLLAGIRTIKIYRAEVLRSDRFRADSKSVAAAATKTKEMRSTIESGSAFVLGVMFTLVIYIGIQRVIAQKLSVGQFTSFVIVLSAAMWPLLNLVNVVMTMIDGLVGLRRVVELLHEPTEGAVRVHRSNMRETDVLGLVHVDRLCFSYGNTQQVLKDVSFRAIPDTVTALVGPSGAGKSTILSILAGFYIPTSGSIRIDDIDLSTIRIESYRKYVALVQQSTFLFPGTIRENVLLAKPFATDAEFRTACKASGLDRVSERLSAKLDTHVGERGVRLSGGQQQRVSIARALLADPRILLLDEATASLDQESEAAVNEALIELMRGRTTILVAHRLSSIMRAHQVLVIDHGEIVESGTHESLRIWGNRYRRLYQHEFSNP